MRKLPLLFALLMISLTACLSDENTWTKNEGWRKANNAWLDEQANKKNPDGTPYYTRIVAPWDYQAYILIRYINDTTLTENNLKPIYNSTVDVKYIGRIYTDEAFDSSYLSTSPADSVSRFGVNNVIGGWTLALTKMHIGDSCEIVIPYAQAYGNTSQGSLIKPYSNLRFNVRLVDIPAYEKPVP